MKVSKHIRQEKDSQVKNTLVIKLEKILKRSQEKLSIYQEIVKRQNEHQKLSYHQYQKALDRTYYQEMFCDNLQYRIGKNRS